MCNTQKKKWFLLVHNFLSSSGVNLVLVTYYRCKNNYNNHFPKRIREGCFNQVLDTLVVDVIED